MRLPTAMAPLRDRPFRLLFTGQAISLLGDGMAPVALAFAVLDATGSASDLGWVLAARSGAMVALLLVGGVIADRVSRRLVMVVADLTRVAAQAATAALVLTGTAQLWELLVLQATFGAAMALFYPALTGLVPATVRPEALQQANALRAIATSGGQVVGPALGGLVVATAGPGWALVADALGFAVDAYFLVRLPAIAVARTAGRFGRQLIEGWQAFTSRTWVWTVVVSASLGNMLFAPVMILGPVAAKQHLGGAVGWGIILAFFGIGSVAGDCSPCASGPPTRSGSACSPSPSGRCHRWRWPRGGRCGRSWRPAWLAVPDWPSSTCSGRPRCSAASRARSSPG